MLVTFQQAYIALYWILISTYFNFSPSLPPLLPQVEAAVRILEDDPAFDAGHGSVLNEIGEIEMDAIIMEGRDLKFGAVAGVKSVANPVSLARLVMEKTDHVMLIGEGAGQVRKGHGHSGSQQGGAGQRDCPKGVGESHQVQHCSTRLLLHGGRRCQWCPLRPRHCRCRSPRSLGQP